MRFVCMPCKVCNDVSRGREHGEREGTHQSFEESEVLVGERRRGEDDERVLGADLLERVVEDELREGVARA